ncbi:MAG: hypothetical protein C0518_11920 [Opitutus sp.]|nr:hypothetical protein [Opitutus sp.]
MAGQREDYLIREMARLRILVAALLDRRNPADVDHALELSLAMQVKLFPLPAREFLSLDAADQFNRLCTNRPADEAAESVLTYAELLVHTATLYDCKERTDLATGARQLALHMALLVALELHDPAGDNTVDLLRRSLAGEQLHAPVHELLGAYDRSRA